MHRINGITILYSCAGRKETKEYKLLEQLYLSKPEAATQSIPNERFGTPVDYATGERDERELV